MTLTMTDLHWLKKKQPSSPCVLSSCSICSPSAAVIAAYQAEVQSTWSQEALGSRKFILNEFWHIFVHDWPIPRSAVNTHANAQPKSVSPFAPTLMDKILGWEEERQWVGSLFVACMWIFTKAVLCNERHHPEDEIVRRLLAIMESVNWVCEDAFQRRT